MGRLVVRPKIDIAFKKIFTENLELLRLMLIDILKLPKIDSIQLRPNEVTPANVDEKFCRLDVRVTVDGREIDIEIQLHNRDDFRARSLYYWALLYTHLPVGDDYEKLPQTIVINFVDFTLFGETNDFHSCFVPMERNRHTLLTNKQEMHFFELKKIPNIENANNDDVIYWLNFISAETEEQITKIENLPKQKYKNAVKEVKKLNINDDFKKNVVAREIQHREEMSALNAAKRVGREEGREEGLQQGLEKGKEEGREEGKLEAKKELVKKLLNRGRPIEEIAEDTGLTPEEIESIAKE
ncbi:MAG: Rpn family recombination-promoting nuclease/putative transposase [Oscillospiraceae bacterium]|jgi:predicted transposase/invertase (TIGR01784 family)|nr:Rpn family recombination-promoting nuclease/putative transposase [Oscillospiraceae bacterium]